MNQKSYTKGVLLLSAGLLAGCVSVTMDEVSVSGRGIIATDDAGRDAFVEMVVENRTKFAVNVWVNWEDSGVGGISRPPRNLGDLAGRSTRTFTVPYQWRAISLGVDVVPTVEALSGVPGGQSIEGVPRGAVVEIGPGDRFEWMIVQIGVSLAVQLTAHHIPDA